MLKYLFLNALHGLLHRLWSGGQAAEAKRPHGNLKAVENML
jgi:hypothetical protein